MIGAAAAPAAARAVPNSGETADLRPVTAVNPPLRHTITGVQPVHRHTETLRRGERA